MSIAPPADDPLTSIGAHGPPLLRRVAAHGAAYAALNAFAILVGLVVLPVYARVLPPEAFGAQDLVLLLVTLVTLTAPLEVAQGLLDSTWRHTVQMRGSCWRQPRSGSRSRRKL